LNCLGNVASRNLFTPDEATRRILQGALAFSFRNFDR
jgi:hypothetical protein